MALDFPTVNEHAKWKAELAEGTERQWAQAWEAATMIPFLNTTTEEGPQVSRHLCSTICNNFSCKGLSGKWGCDERQIKALD